MGFIQQVRDAALLSLVCFIQRIGETAASGAVRIAAARDCKGYQRQSGLCPGLSPCNQTHTELDCIFAEWGDWYEAGGCLGLCWRQRHIAKINNEYGKPCDGAQIESKACLSGKCHKDPEPCMLSLWTAWSTCASAHEQRHRKRKVLRKPRYGGDACEPVIAETKACGDPHPVDCLFSDWAPWTDCSAPCGGGYHTAFRTIKHGAQRGGKLCEGMVHRTLPCNTEACAKSTPCKFTDWQDWKGCTVDTHNQKYRKREIKHAAVGDGDRCQDSLDEVAPCHVDEDSQDCKVSPWSEWGACDRSCDGGQTERSRRMLTPPYSGGKCDVAEGLKQVGTCNDNPCNSKADCIFAPWEEWGKCTTTCGEGTVRRQREVEAEAKQGGVPCSGPVNEIKDCDNKECKSVDCKWGDWTEWDACSCTCGGGSHHRTRVVAESPENGGKLCTPEDKSQVGPCATEPCPDTRCIDGAWRAWEDWSKCSADCDTGFRNRHRELERHPNECGQPAVGLEEEYQVCHNKEPCIPDVDCKLSEWSHWSHCSCECSGVRERVRHIMMFARGNGKKCIDDGLKEIAQCNPGVGEPMPKDCSKEKPHPCQFGNWTEWGTCSSKCGGGQMTRTREVLNPAALYGTPCEGDLAETAECNVQDCPGPPSIDCRWSDWSHWTDCSRCGNQRYRHRHITQLPNQYGKMCQAIDAKQIGQCDSPCEKEQYCGWGDWSMWGGCNSVCNQGTKLRSRLFAIYKSEPAAYLFKGADMSACSGEQIETALCVGLPKCCEPEDCKLGDWSEWTKPSCTQLCERTRTIQKVQSCGGKICDAALTETKACIDTNCTKKVDCIFGTWKEWSPCLSPSAQMSRKRNIDQLAYNGGEQCKGPVKETASCNGPLTQPCTFSDWTKWSNCTRECGGGLKTRRRAIAQRAQSAGKACTGTTEEKDNCNTQACTGKPADCELSDWSEWTGIVKAKNHTKYEDCKDKDQQFRHRKIVTFPDVGGKSCSGNLQEVKPCLEIIDCKVSSWSPWSECDLECGGGQTFRNRYRIHNPWHGGKECPTIQMEAAACNVDPCNNGCEVAAWREWGACSSTCGVGNQERSRSIKKFAEEGGTGCNNDLVEVRPCTDNKPCDVVDCLWSEWSDWSSCSCTCAGGQRTRDRNIKQRPARGGAPCDAIPKEEIQPCNTQPCTDDHTCIDEVWADWEDWQPCSLTCQGGITWRTRNIERQADECGKIATGLDRETKACNADTPCIEAKDCELSPWIQWTDCDQPCSGQRKRGRHIKAHSRGTGAGCVGPLKETAPCNTGKEHCDTKQPVDCELSEWGEWELCSATCDGGSQTRSREVEIEPENGGKGCTGILKFAKPCGMDPCPKECRSLDCLWSDWAPWGACSKAGQKKRHRHVMQQSFCGGKPCEAAVSEEIVACIPPGNHEYFCTWEAWEDWKGCPVTCGIGERIRERHLGLTTAEDAPLPESEADADDEIMEAKFQILHKRSKGIEAKRLQKLTVAFVSGAMCLVVTMIIARGCTSATRSGHEDHRYERAHLASEVELASGYEVQPRVTIE